MGMKYLKYSKLNLKWYEIENDLNIYFDRRNLEFVPHFIFYRNKKNIDLSHRY